MEQEQWNYDSPQGREYRDPLDMPQLQREDRKPLLIALSNSRSEYPILAYDHPTTLQVTSHSFPKSSNLSGSAQSTPKSSGIFSPTVSSVSSLSWTKSKQMKPRRIPVGKRKPCNCTRSQCLKLYCDCFANGEFCLDCNCKDCHNNLEFNHDRSRAIKQSLEKNPNAFKPKIGVANKGRHADMERLHQKGCHCKKSNCLKNYCECFEAKVACTDRCKCCSCRNTEADRQVRFSDRFTAASDLERRTPVSDDELIEKLTARDNRTKLWYYLTDDVVEATTMCLFAQANESEQKNETQVECYNSLFFEFGRCMNQIFDATRLAQKSVAIAAKSEYPLLSDDEEDDDSENDYTNIKDEL